MTDLELAIRLAFAAVVLHAVLGVVSIAIVCRIENHSRARRLQHLPNDTEIPF